MWCWARTGRTEAQPTVLFHDRTITAPMSSSRFHSAGAAESGWYGYGDSIDSARRGDGGWPIKTSTARTSTTATDPTCATSLPRLKAGKV